MIRERIAEPGRYYDSLRTIVLRTGLLLCEERRHLWHELVHADRRDRACDTDRAVERSVEREAARRAMPLVSLEWAAARADHEAHFADLLKLPQDWVRFRLDIAHPGERTFIRAASRRATP